MAGICRSGDFVIPKTCQGSVDPCTNTTFVTFKSNPPYKIFVLLIAEFNK